MINLSRVTWRPVLLVSLLLAEFASFSAQAALVEFSSATIELRGSGGGLTGNARFFSAEAPGLGTTEYVFAVSQDDFGRPDLPPNMWISTFIEDSITTTLSDTEISMRQSGRYANRGSGFEVANNLGYDHQLNVFFEVGDEPQVIELFHSRNNAGSWHPSEVRLINQPLGTALAYASDGAHFDLINNLASGDPIQMTLQPGSYELQIGNQNSFMDIGLSVVTEPRLEAGLRFVTAVPEPITLPLLLMSGLLLVLWRLHFSERVLGDQESGRVGG